MDLSLGPRFSEPNNITIFYTHTFQNFFTPLLSHQTPGSLGRRLSSLQRTVLSSYFSVSFLYLYLSPDMVISEGAGSWSTVSACGLRAHTGLFHTPSQSGMQQGCWGKDSVSFSYPGRDPGFLHHVASPTPRPTPGPLQPAGGWRKRSWSSRRDVLRGRSEHGRHTVHGLEVVTRHRLTAKEPRGVVLLRSGGR